MENGEKLINKKQHIENLCVSLGAKISFIENKDQYIIDLYPIANSADVEEFSVLGIANFHSRKIKIYGCKEIINQEEYFIALHELGHFYHNSFIPKYQNYWDNILEEEGKAWDFALKNTIEPLNKKSIKLAKTAFSRYIEYFPSKRKGPFFNKICQKFGIKGV